MVLSAIAERLKRRSKNDFKGRHFEAPLILQAVCWYLRYPLSVRAKRKKAAWNDAYMFQLLAGSARPMAEPE